MAVGAGVTQLLRCFPCYLSSKLSCHLIPGPDSRCIYRAPSKHHAAVIPRPPYAPLADNKPQEAISYCEPIAQSAINPQLFQLYKLACLQKILI